MIPLNQIQVPEPCGEDWGAMDGDARRRFCAGCGCHVHDLSAMTAQAAQDLLDRADGRVCVRFQTRSDGTVVTQDTSSRLERLLSWPHRLERLLSWPHRLAVVASWVLALIVAGLGPANRAGAVAPKGSHGTPKSHTAPVPKRPHALLGKIAVPHPLPTRTLGIIAQPRRTPAPRPLTTMGAPPAAPMMGDVAPRPPK